MVVDVRVDVMRRLIDGCCRRKSFLQIVAIRKGRPIFTVNTGQAATKGKSSSLM